jgi:PAS domain S-box/PAS domain S-box/PAS domain S-box
MTDHSVADTAPTLQLVVDSDGDREALSELLSPRYDVVVDDTLQPVDCYLISDSALPRYEDTIAELKSETDPTFLPVLLLQRSEDSGQQWLPAADGSEPPLVDEVVTAPIDRNTLYRRLGNLLVRRDQSAELADQYADIQHRFQRLFEATNDAIFVINTDAETITDCNPAACELVGYEREVLQAMRPTATLSADDPAALTAFFDEVNETGAGFTEDLTCRTNAGETRYVELSAATIDSTDAPLLIVSARDISDRKAYQEELELTREAIEDAPIGISISDPTQPDNPSVYVNEGYEEITGYTKAEVTGRNYRFLQGEGTREDRVAEIREAIDAERDVVVELRNYRKDGSMFWNRLNVAPVRNDDGEVTNFIGFQEDITERKQREQRLQLFRKAVDNSANAVLITDREGSIEYVNPAFKAQTGYTADELEGLTPHVIKSGQQSPEFYEELWDTILDGEKWEADLMNQRQSGELYQVHQQITSITNDDDEITHFVAVESDVTERRLREQQLDVLNRVLRHNLRNGMNVIDGNLTLIEEAIDDDSVGAFVDSVQSRIDELERVSERAATVRSLFEQEKPEGAVYPAEEFCADVADIFADRYPDATLTTDAGDIAVKADRRLRVGVIELIDSIMPHNDTPTPAITITATPADGTRAADWVEITVSDNGSGIPAYEWEAIRAGQETPLEHGTGLGLWLVHWTVSLLGGEVEIEDNDSGTQVVLTLPRASTAAVEQAETVDTTSTDGTPVEEDDDDPDGDASGGATDSDTGDVASDAGGDSDTADDMSDAPDA